ncbi:ParA family protein [Anaerofustis butyriciformans]|uniref:ParA family protein n=1 Tax=Anaerofustis butyriciformans TaxID=3108533 RepID=UPI002E352841|nr:AAA family ATPase [Anaerofustis sp. HA2171]
MKISKTISFINHKGGVGKTTSSVMVAKILGEYYNKKVLFLDLDPQGNASSIMNNPLDNIYQLFVKLIINEDTKILKSDYTIEDILKGDIEPSKAIKHSEFKNVDFIPSYITLTNVENLLSITHSVPQQFRLDNELKKIKSDYDYIIIDCSPSINLLNTNALVASDTVYIPMNVSLWAIAGMINVKEIIKQVQTYSNLKLGGTFFTMFEPRKKLHKEVFNTELKYRKEEFIPVTIRKNKLIEDISIEQKLEINFDKVQEEIKLEQELKTLTQNLLHINNITEKEKKEIEEKYNYLQRKIDNSKYKAVIDYIKLTNYIINN